MNKFLLAGALATATLGLAACDERPEDTTVEQPVPTGTATAIDENGCQDLAVDEECV